MSISIELDDRQVLAALQSLIDVGAHMEPVYQDIGEYLVESTKHRFAAGEAPDGSPWAPNKPSTLARKNDPRPLHGESGRLANEIYPNVFADGVDVGSPLVYAAMQQFGAEAHTFGKSPWGDVPAREFLGLSEHDKVEVLDIIQEHLQAATR